MITVQLQECGFLFRVFAISTMLILVALTPMFITRLLILLLIAYQEYVIIRCCGLDNADRNNLISFARVLICCLDVEMVYEPINLTLYT
jgi:hypothetical protein